MSQSQAGAPTAQLLGLINGFMASRVVYIAAELAIADRLANGERTSETLARETGTDPSSLRRLLRALVSLGVLDEATPDHFLLTSMGSALRSDAVDSMRNFALFSGSERMWRIWGDLMHSVRTGATAMAHVYGVESFEYLAAHPQEFALFNRAMADVTRQVTRAVTAACDFSRFRTIVDVGGGNGALMAAILAAFPMLKGVVFDLPRGNADALRLLGAAGVADRCEIVAGDFFSTLPAGADAYVLKNVLHDWNNERAVAILKSCRKAVLPHGTLLLVERLVPERIDVLARHRQITMIDLHMLVGPGGRQRTETEFKGILASAGFVWSTASQLPGEQGLSLIEALPV
jgi:hypothetical protein